MSNEKQFVDGLIVKTPHPRAPDFVKLEISIKRKELGNWLRGKSDEWINIQVKESKGGKLYAEVNEWKPDASKKEANEIMNNRPANADDFDDDIPF